MTTLSTYEVEIRQTGNRQRLDATNRRAALEHYSEALSNHLVGGWEVRELLGEASATTYRSGVVLQHPEHTGAVEIWLTETPLTRAR